jgi:hypothetical protein
MHQSSFTEKAITDEEIKRSIKLNSSANSSHYTYVARGWFKRNKISFDEGDVLELALDLFHHEFNCQ